MNLPLRATKSPKGINFTPYFQTPAPAGEKGNMAVYKNNETNKWTVYIRYSDYTGQVKPKKKTGFKLKRDAEAWERDFLERQATQPDMTFSALCDLYLEDRKAHRKPATYAAKKNRIEAWIRPAFADRPVNEITPADVRSWQADLKSAVSGKTGRPLSPGYLQNLVTELSGIFNHAVTFYGLTSNPARIAGNTVGHKSRSMTFWTRDQFQAFIDTFEPSDPFYAFFMALYWTGARRGEILALTLADISRDRITINKTYNVIDGKEIIDAPKTPRSVREVTIPAALYAILTGHAGRIYGAQPDTRIFSMISRSAAAYQLNKHADLAGVQRIRIHDLRHSHASLLIDLGFSPVIISQRLGHDNVTTTMNIYAHLFPDRQNEVADKLAELI